MLEATPQFFRVPLRYAHVGEMIGVECEGGIEKTSPIIYPPKFQFAFYGSKFPSPISSNAP